MKQEIILTIASKQSFISILLLKITSMSKVWKHNIFLK